jgi:uncharacterized protein YkwD
MARAVAVPAGRRAGACVALALLTLAVFVALGATNGTTAAFACAHATDGPHQTTLAKLNRAMQCLVNNKRAKHDLRPLKQNSKLATAARSHTKVMLKKDCFEHKCPGEAPFGKRVKRTGYTKGAKRYFYAESLGYHRSPKRTIRKLMQSGYNRRNILGDRWRDIGVGAGWGAPVKGVDDKKFETFTIVFAWRKSK